MSKNGIPSSCYANVTQNWIDGLAERLKKKGYVDYRQFKIKSLCLLNLAFKNAEFSFKYENKMFFINDPFEALIAGVLTAAPSFDRAGPNEGQNFFYLLLGEIA